MIETYKSKTDRKVGPLSERAANILKNSNYRANSQFMNKFKDKLDTLSPFMQKKLENLSMNKTNKTIHYRDQSFYDKYSSFWAKPKTSLTEIRLFALIFEKMKARILRNAFRKIDKVENTSSPIAATICPKCSHVGLTLLTTSTKENLSPRFMEKIKLLLPSKKNEVSMSSLLEEKDLSLSIAPTEYRYSKRSIYNDPESPEEIKLIRNRTITTHTKHISELPDLSEIHINSCDKHSYDSDEISDYESKVNSSHKVKEDISFDCIDQFTDSGYKTCENSLNRGKMNVPKLNISAINKPPRYKTSFTNLDPRASGEVLTGSPIMTFSTRGFTKLSELLNRKLKPIFTNIVLTREKLIDNSLSFEFSREDLQSSMMNLDSILEGTFDFGLVSTHKTSDEIRMLSFSKNRSNEPNLSQKTAFRIFHSKIGKLIFRRKMSSFFTIAELTNYQ